MALTPEGKARSELFHRVIEKYELLPISCRMNMEDFAQARKRIEAFAIQMNWSLHLHPWSNPYFCVFHALVDNFYKLRPEIEHLIPLKETSVNFIFDQQSEEALLPLWNDHLAARPEKELPYYGAKPRFENDQEFLALQAADFWAWWVRKWYEEDAFEYPKKMKSMNFGLWQGKPRKMIALSMHEDGLFNMLQKVAFESLPFATKDGKPIFD
jgi:hypothetical protein